MLHLGARAHTSPEMHKKKTAFITHESSSEEVRFYYVGNDKVTAY